MGLEVGCKTGKKNTITVEFERPRHLACAIRCDVIISTHVLVGRGGVTLLMFKCYFFKV